MLLPTPSTSHVDAELIYSPAEDSFLLLDTLSSAPETAFLAARFPASTTPAPLVLELGTGSGVVLAFLTAHARAIFRRADVLCLAADLNPHACRAAAETVARACRHPADPDCDPDPAPARRGCMLGALCADLAAPIRSRCVDVLVFNPPYVPTPTVPTASAEAAVLAVAEGGPREARFREQSRLLELAYAGGKDGMEVTARLLEELPRVLSARGACYLLLCRRNRPEEVADAVRRWEGGGRWAAEVVGRSGKTAGWEKLCVLRIARVTG